MATKYEQGRETEYLAQKELLSDGWPSLRSAGSKTPTDIYAWNIHGSRFIQCKRYTTRPGNFTIEIGKLLTMQLPPNASAELWIRCAGRTGWIDRMLIQHTYDTPVDIDDLDDMGRQMRFTEEINPDRVSELAARANASAKAARPAKPTTRTRRKPPSVDL